MTAPSSNWNPRRRRIVTTFVLMLVSALTWWNWPRGDARFVGTWAVQYLRTNTAGSTIGAQPGAARLVLQANGVGRWDTAATRIVYFSWETDGDALVTGTNWPDLLKQGIVLFNRHIFRRWGGRVIQDKKERWEILEDQGDALRLKFGNSPWLVDLRRASE
jgi:hypothetical protein